MVLGFLIGFVAAILIGMGITLALGMMFVGGGFWVVLVLWFAALGVFFYGAIKLRMKLGLVFLALMTFGAIVPLIMGWVP